MYTLIHNRLPFLRESTSHPSNPHSTYHIPDASPCNFKIFQLLEGARYLIWISRWFWVASNSLGNWKIWRKYSLLKNRHFLIIWCAFYLNLSKTSLKKYNSISWMTEWVLGIYSSKMSRFYSLHNQTWNFLKGNWQMFAIRDRSLTLIFFI